jgi:integrase
MFVQVHVVRQRADKYNAIDNPKSEDGHRTVPMLQLVANALREWKLSRPRRDTDLFPKADSRAEMEAAERAFLQTTG